jgi:hypothetical protein
MTSGRSQTIGLLSQTLVQLSQGISNSAAAQWFGQQIQD